MTCWLKVESAVAREHSKGMIVHFSASRKRTAIGANVSGPAKHSHLHRQENASGEHINVKTEASIKAYQCGISLHQIAELLCIYLPASSLTLLTAVQFLQASGMLLLPLQFGAAVR